MAQSDEDVALLIFDDAVDGDDDDVAEFNADLSGRRPGQSSLLPRVSSATKTPVAAKKCFDVFLSHNWGVDCDNHKRVEIIREALEAPGRDLRVWLDEVAMTGHIYTSMETGIAESGAMAVFVTREYMDKVGSPKKPNASSSRWRVAPNFQCPPSPECP